MPLKPRMPFLPRKFSERKSVERKSIQKRTSEQQRLFSDRLRRELEKENVDFSKEASEWVSLQLKEITARMHLTPQQKTEAIRELVFIARKLEQKQELSNNLPEAHNLRILIEANPLEALRFLSNLVNLDIPVSSAFSALREFQPLLNTRNPTQIKKTMIAILAGYQKHKQDFFSPNFSQMRQMIAKSLARTKTWEQIPRIIENPMQKVT